MEKSPQTGRRGTLELARVLLVDDDPTSRLTLQTVLEAGGYHVDAAASAAEAIRLMESGEYELVLTDLRMESPKAGLKVLAHARMMDYKPATALITTYRRTRTPAKRRAKANQAVLIQSEDLPELLGKVAELISERATRRVERELRHTRN
ncbi:MAG: response regulator [Bryobacterales bacterium]|nr:response regulator [Bryobacteraceae bacterium]MDW8355042.1 response regulator [Bryobacterales bacterium]